MCVVVSYLYVNDECIVIRVVEMSSIIFREFNDGVVDLHHLWDEAY